MKAHGGFKTWGQMEKIDRLCSGLVEQSRDDLEWLSKMGAVRMSRNEVMEFVRANSSTEGYHVRMVSVNRPLEPCL
eukprot:8188659-Heterocapsa_arctica.AAC.1